MRKLINLAVIMLLAVASQAQQAKHLIFISVDGFRPDFYLDTPWRTPTIRQLMKEGSYAKGVNSVFPSMTYPSHTTIISGVQPAQHGIFSNAMFEPEGSTGKIYWNYHSIKSPTIFDAAAKKGLKVASLYWPVSADAPVAYNIPDIGGMGDSILLAYTRPAGLMTELKKNAFGGISKIDHGKNVNIAKMAAYLISKDMPDLMTIHFFAVDHAEHLSGRNGEMVREAVADADSGVAIIIDALKQAGVYNNTVLLVGGDHGFVDVQSTVSPNTWLAKAGLFNDVKTDWKAQFFPVGGAAFLFTKDNDQKLVQQVKNILSNLSPAEKKLFRIIDKQQITAIGANPGIQLALSATNGGSFNGAYTGETIKAGHGGTHGYFPDFKEIRTGFVAVGPGIQKGGVIDIMNLKDIAPLICRLMNLTLPSVEGKIPAGVLRD